MQHTIQHELKGVIAFVAAIWAVFLLDWVLPTDLNSFGLTPRTRVLFGAHFPMDVLAGTALGTASALLVAVAFERVRVRVPLRIRAVSRSSDPVELDDALAPAQA